MRVTHKSCQKLIFFTHEKVFISFCSNAFYKCRIGAGKRPCFDENKRKEITLSEFEYIYNKNNSDNVLDKKSLNEYVDLFVVFKLKVEEALSQKLDTLSSFKTELASYQKQLAEPYLQDSDEMEKLLNEAYDRKKNEVEVSHILIKIPNAGSAADTLQAYNQALAIWKRTAKEDFTKLAAEVSEDPSVGRNNGYVGWITALRTPYAFETTAFTTPVGSVSKPVRTFLGYHLIKVINKRVSRGEALAAHIMKFTRPDSIKEQAKTTIDSIYARVKAGDDFAELAKKYSDDKGSARNGGELMWFRNEQRMVPEFEDAAFALKNKGDVSEPVLSLYGWHIIKLLDKKPLPAYDEMKGELEVKIRNDERMQKVKDAFGNKIKQEAGFTLDKPALDEVRSFVSKFASNDSLYNVEAAKLNKTLFTVGNEKYSQKDFAAYLKSSVMPNIIQAEIFDYKLNNYVNEKLTDYEKNQLDKKYSEYHHLMNEYHDGILLFDVSNQEVWEKATKDTEGLKKYFAENKQNYSWEKPHYKGRVIYCKDKATLKAAKSIVKKADNDSIDKYLKTRLNDSITYVKTEKGLWIEGDSKAVDAQIFKKEKYQSSEEYPYYFVAGKLLKTTPESYEDVRGAVTTDYQNYLEKEWVAALRQKYPVSIDENVLKTLISIKKCNF
jgi:peptidyl-prolyl cis-trans isomerase SurA